MTVFLDTILSTPTVVFTVMLIVIVLYWLMVIVGAIGVDILHIGEAAGAKLEGMVGGAVEGKIEGIVGGAVEAKIEGAVESKIEGLAEPGGGGFLATLGFGKVPATVVISSLVLWSWALCMLGARLGAHLGLPGWSLQLLAPVAAVFLSGLLTGLIVQVISRLLGHHEPVRRADLVGKLCTITTGRVDAGFGQALISEHGIDLTVDVRCDPPNSLRRHAQAVIVGHDVEHNYYTVEAYDQPLAPLSPPGARTPGA
jgi:hypothetical protein